ncbi:family 43 glycosylhydrolase [Fulvivirga ligni]|uniref:family 43 glycosylhydrolase n=1 Tax=Fulvivirga ligni TaxID=2904246 RepID=UPI001F23FCA1|nr:family 43 glycosylhydrolase [Fulvivirga ligni]UII19548.1 family 43 glycosylhydrolase [Fulvivirga ligni]
MRRRFTEKARGSSYLVLLIMLTSGICKAQQYAGNPVIEGWYADPDAAVLNEEYWIFPTSSIDCVDQTYFDAFSSPDLVNWTKHNSIVNNDIVTWADRCMWAPGIAEKDGKYYFFFSAEGIDFDNAIGVCVADNPAGPYVDLIGAPLLGEYHNGAQPIDQSIFQDVDGQFYMLYGGEGHCNIVKLNDNFTGFVPFEDGSVFREITPHPDYVEGPVMFRRNNQYYLMWSEGLWFAGNYRVAYGVSDSPFGPFDRVATVLQGNDQIASGPGHHSIIQVPEADEWYMVYHRKPLGDNDGNHRYTCIDKMYFDGNGFIQPIQMTNQGVEKRPLGSINIASGKPVIASSTFGGNIGSNITDNNISTRWESEYTDYQWVYVDLGGIYDISQVDILWENAYGSNYMIQVSEDASSWTTVRSITGNTELDVSYNNLNARGRFVRIFGATRGTIWGYSIYELSIFGNRYIAPNRAFNQPVVASSFIGGNAGGLAVDGDKTDSRWESEYSDPQWLYVDLEQNYNIRNVKITWEGAYASNYELQVSQDGSNWSTVKSVTANNSIVNDHNDLNTSGRYFRILGTTRATIWGYSIYEVEVYGEPLRPGSIGITDLGGVLTSQYSDSPIGEGLGNLIDNNIDTKYLTLNPNCYIEYQADESHIIRSYELVSANDNPQRDPLSWTLEGSADGVTWHTLDTRNDEDFNNRFQARSFSISNNTAYRYYKFNFNNNSGNILQLSELELFEDTMASNSIPKISPRQSLDKKPYPMPFEDDVLIPLEIEEPTQGVMTVYDFSGKIVFSKEMNLSSQKEIIKWQGKNENGTKVKPGIYIIKIESEAFVLSKKVIKE